MKKNLLSKAIIIFIFALMALGIRVNTYANAEANFYKFDFGNGDEQEGYIKIGADFAYDASLGYGFNTPENMKNVSASGTGAESDAVQFLTYGTKSDNTFNVDLPNGLYEIKVVLGNTSRSSVAAEGVYQIMNMTGNCAEDKFQIPVTDGQLNILITEGKAGSAFTLSSMEISKLSDNPETNRTIYLGGDSTVCNYYPLDSSEQCGWGQLLPKYINTNTFQVRDMATGGQIARGFRDDGQFEAVMKYIKPGDYFILQFGINDCDKKNNETEAEFKEIMRDMIKQIKDKGATVILSTPQGRASDFNSEGVHSSVNKSYRNSTVALASEENVPLVDLTVLSSAYYTSIGKDATTELYIKDKLHPNRAGATELARIVANELHAQGLDGF